ncbi:GAF domain-containing protein, partial [Thermodesulfobacteriota bacterium]
MMEKTKTEIENNLKEQLRFETLLSEISARYINLPVDQIDAGIEDDQRRICEHLGIDLSALWQWSDGSPRFLTVTHLYSLPEGPSRPEGIDAQKTFPWVLKKMLSGETLVLSTEEMPPEAAIDEESRRYFGVKSSVVLPLSAGGDPLIGVLTFDTLREERDWPDDLVKRLKLVAQIFSNSLVRKESDRIHRESKARLNLAAESAGAGLWELDCITNQFWATEVA